LALDDVEGIYTYDEHIISQVIDSCIDPYH